MEPEFHLDLESPSWSWITRDANCRGALWPI